jgi:hypothetical protein
LYGLKVRAGISKERAMVTSGSGARNRGHMASKLCGEQGMVQRKEQVLALE